MGKLPANIGFTEIAPILCAGVTVYKGLKVLDCKPGDWVAISGIGGLVQVAVQYAKAMGLHVVAVDVADDKLALAKKLGADMVVNATTQDPVKELQSALRGVHGVQRRYAGHRQPGARSLAQQPDRGPGGLAPDRRRLKGVNAAAGPGPWLRTGA